MGVAKSNHCNTKLIVWIFVVAVFLASMTLTTGYILSGAFSFAADSTSTQVNATVTVGSACSLDATEDVAHTAKGTPGTTTSDIGLTTLKTVCNDGSGYAIYAVGYSGLEFGNTKMLATISGEPSSTNDIVTGTNTSGNTSNWAMKLNAVAGTYAPIIVGSSLDSERQSTTPDFSGYTAIPNTYTRVAYRNSATDTITGSSIQSTYRTYITGAQPAGTYEGKVKYTLVHPSSEIPLSPQTPTARCINYFANASNAVGTMGCQSAADGNTITLLASNFSRSGYGFAGWSDAYDYATNPNANLYGPQEDITVPTGTTANGLSLYAIWIKSEGSLQDQSKVASVCNRLTTAPTGGTANLTSVSALTDQRDNQTYAIAKLADGNCWMIENLRLEAEHTRSAEDQALAQGYGTSATYGNFGGLASAESANFSDSTTANSLYYSGAQSSDATIDIGTTDYPGYRMPRYNNLNTSTRASNPTSNNGNMYSYGNYYTWHAAIADLTYNDTNNQSTTGTSLCPAGWHLPTGGMAYASGSTSGVNVTGNTSTFREFYNLGYKTMDEVKTAYEDTPNSGYSYYSSNTTNTAGKTATAAFRSFPNNFLYSGYLDSSSAGNRGSTGYYWSSTANSNSLSYSLSLSSKRSLVYPGINRASMYFGYSIRCMVET